MPKSLQNNGLTLRDTEVAEKKISAATMKRQGKKKPKKYIKVYTCQHQQFTFLKVQ